MARPRVKSKKAIRAEEKRLEKEAEAGFPTVDPLDDDIPEFDAPGFGFHRSTDKAEKTDRKVIVIKDHILEYPQLYLEVWLTGPRGDRTGFAELFSRSMCKAAKSLETADLCIFTGGSDVCPTLYGEEPHPTTKWSDDRDSEDMNTYLKCLDQGIPMLGVCRGAQFLAVMNGDALYQDVDNHYGDHLIFDIKGKKCIHQVSSVHHQAVRRKPDSKMEIIAIARKSRKRWVNPKDCVEGNESDIEAFFYRETCCLGIQGHPEYRNYNQFSIWCMQQLENYFILNPDLDWAGSNRRIKPDLITQRIDGVLATISKGVN